MEEKTEEKTEENIKEKKQEKKKEKTIKRVIKKTIKLIFILIVIYVVSEVIQKVILKEEIPEIFGYKSFIVVSGSMSPAIEVGDVVIVKEAKEIEKGEIISYRIDGTIVTHRVEEVIEEDGKRIYKTKGDANATEDKEIVKEEAVEGKYCFKIPKVGKLILGMQEEQRVIVIIAIQSILIVWIITSNIEISREKEEKEDSKIENEKEEVKENRTNADKEKIKTKEKSNKKAKDKRGKHITNKKIKTTNKKIKVERKNFLRWKNSTRERKNKYGTQEQDSYKIFHNKANKNDSRNSSSINSRNRRSNI